MLESIPKISIIIPVYLTEAYLSDCLDSAINQTMQDIQIIVVNDASPDQSQDILDQYLAADSRIQVIVHENNKGLLQARLSGLRIANGEYVIFLDSDDKVDIHLCERIYNVASKNKTDIVQFGTELITELSPDSDIITNLENRLLPFNQSLFGIDIFVKFFVERTYSFSMWAKMFKRNLWERVDEEITDTHITMGEDLYLYTYVALKAKSCVSISDKLYQYRFGSGISSMGVSHQNKRIDTLDRWNKYLSVQRACEGVKRLINRHHSAEIYQDALLYWQKIFFNASCYNFLLVTPSLRPSAFSLLCSAWGSSAIAEHLLKSFYGNPDFYSWMQEWWLQLINESEGVECTANSYTFNEISNILPFVIRKLSRDLDEHKQATEEYANQKICDEKNHARNIINDINEAARIKIKNVEEAAEIKLRETEENARNRINKIEADYNNSLSWRLTKPLRIVNKILNF